MVNRRIPSAIFAGLAAVLAGCATIPGKTRQEQVETIDQLVARTLADLKNQYPQSRDELVKAVGYVVMNNKITKIPVFGAGAGYGVAVDNQTGDKTYLQMSRFDFGAGWGARSVRPVLIFHDKKKFGNYIQGSLDGTFGAEASAKVGEKGAAGGADTHKLKSPDLGYTSYAITDAGVSATMAAGIVRVKPIKLKKY